MSRGLAELGVGHAYAPGKGPGFLGDLVAILSGSGDPGPTLGLAIACAVVVAALVHRLWGGPGLRAATRPGRGASGPEDGAPGCRRQTRALLAERIATVR